LLDFATLSCSAYVNYELVTGPKKHRSAITTENSEAEESMSKSNIESTGECVLGTLQHCDYGLLLDKQKSHFISETASERALERKNN
jgi:hypothetical protein